MPVEVVLAQSVAEPNGAQPRALIVGARAASGRRARRRRAQLIEPGAADASVLTLRMRSRNPRVQMPPLGTAVPDTEALALIERWIDISLPTRRETKP